MSRKEATRKPHDVMNKSFCEYTKEEEQYRKNIALGGEGFERVQTKDTSPVIYWDDEIIP